MKVSFRIYAVFLAFFCFCCTGALAAQQFSLSKFDFETRFFERDGSAALTSLVETGGTLSLAKHFRISAGLSLFTGDMLDFFHAAESKKKDAMLELDWIAVEFPVAVSGGLVPALFSGKYGDLSSGDLLFRTLRATLEKPLFSKYGPMEIFSDKTETSGAGAALIWTAETIPLAAAAYAFWNADSENPGYNIYAQTAGAGQTLLWNIFAGIETGGNAGRDDGVYFSAGFSAEAGAGNPFSLYMQTKILPFEIQGGKSLSQEVSEKIHFLLEPRFNGSLFSLHTSFFISPVLEEKEIPYLDINSDGQYFGMNLRFVCGSIFSHRQNLGFDFTIFSDTDINTDYNSEDFIFCVSPFFNISTGGSIITFSVTLNPAKIDSLLSAGEINLHIKAAL